MTAAALAMLLVLSACTGDGTSATPTPSPTPSPGPMLSPTPILSPQSSPTIQADTVVDLASDPPPSILGPDAGDLRNDLPALVTGDFNDDGLADVLLGARFGDGPNNGRQDAGEAYVIFGSSGPLRATDLAAGQQDLTIWGARAGDNLGFSAAAADVNSDKVDDIVLGAPFAQPAGANTGAAYVIFGGRGLSGTIDLADGAAGATLAGPGNSSFFGDSVAAGDVNGDGIADVIVGATFAAGAAGSPGTPGATYVLFGRRHWPSALAMDRKEYDAAVFAADNLDELGDTVASGDINDDGLDDIIMTAEAADGPDNARATAAEVHIVFGSKQLAGDLLIAKGDQDISVLGADENDTLGFSLAVGDANGDGVDDVMMGARGDNGAMNAANRVGAVYILLGGHDLPAIFDLAQSPAGIVGLYGADDADSMDMAIAGDLNGDGKNELILGATAGDGPANVRPDAGEVYVLGTTTVAGMKGNASISASRLAAEVFGAREGDHLGTAIAVADINGDGQPELLALAADADGPDGARADAGQVFIVSLPGS